MTYSPERRQRVVAYLRYMATRSEALAAEYRREADRLEGNESGTPDVGGSGGPERPADEE